MLSKPSAATQLSVLMLISRASAPPAYPPAALRRWFSVVRDPIRSTFYGSATTTLKMAYVARSENSP